VSFFQSIPIISSQLGNPIKNDLDQWKTSRFLSLWTSMLCLDSFGQDLVHLEVMAPVSILAASFKPPKFRSP
jgi:hypothetical protein